VSLIAAGYKVLYVHVRLLIEVKSDSTGCARKIRLTLKSVLIVAVEIKRKHVSGECQHDMQLSVQLPSGGVSQAQTVNRPNNGVGLFAIGACHP